jgi:hypothetical protein
MAWSFPASILLIIAALRGGTGGTLADAQFYEAIRRAILPASTRSITMADVPAAAPRPQPVALVAADPDPTAKVAVAPPSADANAKAKDDERGTESDWRARAVAARDALERDEVLFEAVQSRVNALTTDSVNRDDPAQRAEIMKQRIRALTELDRLRLQIEKDKLAIAALEEDARKKGIPPGWIR